MELTHSFESSQENLDFRQVRKTADEIQEMLATIPSRASFFPFVDYIENKN
jgi:hypothetical protein